MPVSVSEHLTTDNAAKAFAEAAAAPPPPTPVFSGSGVVMAAGGPFLPGAYVVVRLLRRFGLELPIEIWHAGPDEIPDWARHALVPWGVTLRDVAPFCPGRPLSELRGWAIKAEALVHSRFRHVLFLDADCFPVRNPEFLFATPEFERQRAVFWPDSRHHRLVSGASIWRLTGLTFRDDPEFETGLLLLDKEACWRELSLVRWMNRHSSFWYQHVLGDKDTFYLAWRKLERSFFLAPACRRRAAVVTNHYWIDGAGIAQHRTGTSKYGLPRRFGPLQLHLTPYKWRPNSKNVYDELMQRFLIHEFPVHVSYLRELALVHDAYVTTATRAAPASASTLAD